MVMRQKCPFCGKQLEFIADYQRWYCSRCQRYLGYFPKRPSRRTVIAAGIAILVVLGFVLPSMILYVWVAGFSASSSYGEPAGGGAPTLAMSRMGTNDALNQVSFIVDAASAGGIRFSELTWLLLNATSAATYIATGVTHTDLDGDGYVEAGDSITITAPNDGDFKVQVIYKDTSIYESTTYHF